MHTAKHVWVAVLQIEDFCIPPSPSKFFLSKIDSVSEYIKENAKKKTVVLNRLKSKVLTSGLSVVDKRFLKILNLRDKATKPAVETI